MRKLPKRSIADIFALTPMQEGMLFYYLRNPGSEHYFEQLSLEICGDIKIDLLEKAWNHVIETNETLRAAFRWERLDNPVQIILKEHRLQPRYYDFSNMEANRKKAHIKEIKVKDRKEKFDLREVPFRVTLCRIEKEKYEMIISNHHILYDGWSSGIILKEFFKTYDDLFSGNKLQQPGKTRYKEFIKWNRDHGKEAGRQEKFWKAYLKGFESQTGLSVKRKNWGGGIKDPGAYSLRLNKEETHRLAVFVKKHRITLAAMFYSAWGLLLQKYNSADGVIFGTAVSGRSADVKGIEDIVGLFINTLPLRVQRIPGEKTGDLLHRIDSDLREIERYETVSLVDIKTYSELDGREELFDSLVVLENYPLAARLKDKSAQPRLSIDSYAIVETAPYDLTVSITAFGDIDALFTYDKGAFADDTIVRLANHFRYLLENMLKNPGKEPCEIEIVLPEEKKKLLFEFNQPARDYPGEIVIHRLFEEQAARTPDSAAVFGHGGMGVWRHEGIHITYRELNRKSNQLAHALKEKGVLADDIVAIKMARSVDMLISVLGILKAGGAYLPIDPASPRERIDYMLKDSNAGVLVSEVSEVSKVSKGTEVLKIGELSKGAPTHLTQLTHLCYVIYTSGTSGRPKGTLVEHRSLVNLCYWHNRYFGITGEDHAAQYANIGFDASVWEIFPYLIKGVSLYIIDDNIRIDIRQLCDYYEKHRITIGFLPTQFCRQFMEEGREISSLRVLLTGGDKLNGFVERGYRLYNNYGPTENTVVTTSYLVEAHRDDIPIGRPVDNNRVYILAVNSLQLQPIGIPGELCIAGVGLARGYLNNPDLTTEKFVNYRSYMSYKTHRFYKTGDLARWLPQGNIEFLGRIDNQVKIRGFRIEPGEIETHLRNHDKIKDAVVVALEPGNAGDKFGPGGDNYLCAYIISDRTLSAAKIKKYLAKHLPDYMIPSYLVLIDRIPLTPGGKVDGRKLPRPEIKPVKKYEPPRNPVEKKLIEIWQEVLGPGGGVLPSFIGIDDNFFELGGHSLKIAGLRGRIHKAFDIEIPFPVFFEFPTVRGIGGYIKDAVRSLHEPIPLVEEKEYYPLTTAQKRFFVFQSLEPGDTSYNIPETILLEGLLSIERFTGIFEQLIRRHESLRTFFRFIKGKPVQGIRSDVEFRAESYDLTELEGSIKEKEQKTIGENFVRSFDLSKPPLFRLGFIKVEVNKYFLMFDMHHIISDGVSVEILVREFRALYSGENLPPLRLRCRDYVEWRMQRRSRDALCRGISQGAVGPAVGEEVLNLPCDYVRPAEPVFAGKTVKFAVGPREKEALYSLSLRLDVTLYMVLLSAFYVFLSRLSGQENIVVGSPMAGRVHTDLQGIIGLFINTLVLRNVPSGEKRFVDFLKEVKENALDAFENQDYQYDELVGKIGAARNIGRNPLFDVMFAMQNMERPKIEVPGFKVTLDMGEYRSSKFDMTLYCEEEEEEDILVFRMEYSTALFKEVTILRFIGYFKEILSSILRAPGKKISEIEFIPGEEKKRILYGFNDTGADYPGDIPLQRLFEEQVEKVPDKTVLVSGDQSLTYCQLNRRANRLARVLRARGVRADTVVGIMLERSLELSARIYAVLKAGGVYLPIDPRYPDARIAAMLKNSRSPVLLTERQILEDRDLGDVSLEIVMADELTREMTSLPGENLEPANGPGDLIYIIFTSGSTGVPRGAGVFQRGFVNLMNWFIKDFELSSRDINLLMTSFSFDLTQKNLYASSLCGGILVIPAINYFDPREVLGEIAGKGVTWINCTPSMFARLVEYGEGDELKRLSTLRYVYLGGEPIVMSMLMKWLESGYCRGEIVNTYGPTECTDISNAYRVREPRRFLEEAVPIGKPIYNVRLYILDRNSGVLPVGIPGELCIAGDGVGSGYVNDRRLTSEKFITVTLDDREIQLYRTGDLVKWLPDGNVEFIGRMDHQVKVRGFRIEPGEIENRLLEHEAVKEAVVMARKREGGDNYLCAYLVPEDPDLKAELTRTGLREFLLKGLPEYMVPGYFILLENMPLSPNGKVDRKALPEPDPRGGTEYVSPRSKTEKSLLSLWAEVLNLHDKHIGIDDNFFELGGHSLRAATLVGRIHTIFSVDIPITDLFKNPTIRGISRYIEETKEKSFYSSIQAMEKRDYYALSSAQQRLFVIQRMDPVNLSYNLPGVLIMEGELDRHRFAGAVKELINRHESLRTAFEWVEGEPLQRVRDVVEFEIEYDNLAAKNAKDREDVIENFIRPFDLSRAPLFRVGLIIQGREKFVFRFDMHHIISDGVSMGIFTKEFINLYKGERLPGLELQYRDFSHWQNRLLESGIIERQETYWLGQFAGEIPVLNLPVDFPRPPAQEFSGSRVKFEIKREETGWLKKLALETGTTLFIVLLSCFELLLSKLSGQQDIIVGIPTAGRRQSELENIVGMFVNTLALRIDISLQKTFPEFLIQVKEDFLAALENQDYQYERLVETVVKERNLSRNPLFDVVFVLQNMETHREEIPGLRFTSHEYELNISKFDLTLQCEEGDENLFFSFEYSTALFKEETVRGFASCFSRLLRNVLADSKQALWKIEFLSEEEKEKILFDFNNTFKEYPRDKTIHQLFAEQAMRMPDSVAVVDGGRHPQPIKKRTAQIVGAQHAVPISVDHVSLTYKELNRKSDQLSHLLGEKGVGPDIIVGIMMERSLEMIIGILGILKAGGAYLPIEPDYPKERIEYMLADSGAKILLKNLSEEHHIDSPASLLPRFLASRPSNLAYVIYTSGSSGRPKGVGVEHGAVVNLLDALFQLYPFVRADRYLFKTSFLFDVSVSELFGWFMGSGTVVVLPAGDEKDPQAILDTIAVEKITHINFVPAMLNVFLDTPGSRDIAKLSSLKYIFSAGEALSPEVVDKFRRLNTGIRLENLYGPTEGTVYTSYYSLLDWDGRGKIPIGRPLANIRLYILDKANHLQPVGIPGELCIAGSGLARGYLNNPALTAEKFFLVSYKSYRTYRTYNSQKIYKTGDLARWLPEGNIEFLGRIDHQVKIRGYRIELGEIEQQLQTHEGIREAVAVDREDRNGHRYLCAYITAAGECPVSRLRQYLERRLPGYMIPSFFVMLDKIPLTASGKIDRKSLPEPDVPAGSDSSVSPQNETEEKLVKLWQEVLGIQTPGVTDNFFTLGGHSLKAMILISRISREWGVEFPLKKVFENPTIRGFACFIREEAGKGFFYEIKPVEKKEYYPLSSIQKRLYFLHQIQQKVGTGYNVPGFFKIEGPLDKKRFRAALSGLVKRHEALRTCFRFIHNDTMQVIRDTVDFQVEEIPLPANRGLVEEWVETIIGDFIRPFNLEAAPLFRAGLAMLAKEEYLLLFDIHHIIADGISATIIFNEFAALYGEEELPPLNIHYKDFALWQNYLFTGEDFKRKEQYWLNRLSGELPRFDLPTDFPRTDTMNFVGDVHIVHLDQPAAVRLREIITREGTTLFIYLLAVLDILLYKYYDQDDIIVGCGIAGRRHADLQQVIGMLANVLPIRTRIDESQSFALFLAEVKQNSIDAFENQEVQFERLVEQLDIPREPGRNPIFDVLFMVQNYEPPSIHIEGVAFSPYRQPGNFNSTAKYDISLFISETEAGIQFYIEYSTSLFRRETIEKFARRFMEILEQVMENQTVKLEDIEVFSQLAAIDVKIREDEEDDFNF